MSQEAFATIAGYATADPTLRMTKTGAAVVHVRVACTPRRLDRGTGEWKDSETTYFSVTCWRKLAIAVKASIRKGDPVLVRGRFRTRTWANDSRTVTDIEIEADAMGHDLTLGWAVFQRDRRVMPGLSADLGNGESARQLPSDEQDGTRLDEEEDYAGTSPDDPDDGDPGALAAESDPRTPIAPTESSDFLTEQAMAELSEELDEATGVSVPA